LKILQINTSVNTGSTGRIAEEIGEVMMQNGFESAIAYGRGNRPSSSKKIKIGNKLDVYIHVLQTRLLDNHGFASKAATLKLIKEIEAYNPDVIGLHNLHGYYLHIGVLFDFFKEYNKPLVWTFHDCWPFTGHCAHFDYVGCEKWKTQCIKCPLTKRYPSSLGFDNSRFNFYRKKSAFNKIENLTIVTPSQWLSKKIFESYLSSFPIKVIHNGIDLNLFKRINLVNEEKIILGVASVWDRIKGLDQFIELRKILDIEYKIVLVGLNNNQIKNLPEGIVGIRRTNNIQELVKLYNKAAVFINPTLVDNFPTVNLEALACGTPVITYNTGGSPEAIDEETGVVVEKGDIKGLKTAIESMLSRDQTSLSQKCRERAEKFFDKNERFNDYLNLYRSLLDGK